MGCTFAIVPINTVAMQRHRNRHLNIRWVIVLLIIWLTWNKSVIYCYVISLSISYQGHVKYSFLVFFNFQLQISNFKSEKLSFLDFFHFFWLLDIYQLRSDTYRCNMFHIESRSLKRRDRISFYYYSLDRNEVWARRYLLDRIRSCDKS